MKWTRRDTAYLSVILLLSAVLAVLLLADQIGSAIAPLVHDETRQPVKVGGDPLYSSGDGNGVIIDNMPELHKVEPVVSSRRQSRIIEITPGMTRAEMATALGVSPDDLPPSEEIGVVDD